MTPLSSVASAGAIRHPPGSTLRSRYVLRVPRSGRETTHIADRQRNLRLRRASAPKPSLRPRSGGLAGRAVAVHGAGLLRGRLRRYGGLEPMSRGFALFGAGLMVAGRFRFDRVPFLEPATKQLAAVAVGEGQLEHLVGDGGVGSFRNQDVGAHLAFALHRDDAARLANELVSDELVGCRRHLDRVRNPF